MPSRKLTAHCPRCRGKNHLRSNYCTQCGADLRQEAVFQPRDNSRLYADIAHPINAECRELIQSRVIEEFEKEQELAQLPGYRSRYDDEYDLLAGESDESSDVADESSPASGRERTGKSQAGRSQSKRRDGGKAVPRKRSSDQERHRSDPPESSGLSGAASIATPTRTIIKTGRSGRSIRSRNSLKLDTDAIWSGIVSYPLGSVVPPPGVVGGLPADSSQPGICAVPGSPTRTGCIQD